MGRHHKSRFQLGASALSLFVFGTGSSLLSKIIYELEGPDREGHLKLFHKPWASTWAMFVGMMLCLPLPALGSWARRCFAAAMLRRSAAEDLSVADSLLSASASGSGSEFETVVEDGEEAVAEKPPGPPARQYAYILVPTVFDLAATVLMSVGLLYITVSVFQMVRGVEVVFSALFSMLFLGRTLNRHHLSGILICMAGIALVGLASVLSGEGSAAQPVSTQKMVAGMLLVVAAEAVQAGQVVVEDHVMSSLHFDPVLVVGYEGLFGTVLVGALLLPILQALPGPEGQGLHEDSIESFHMLAGSPALQRAAGLYLGTMALYNIAGMLVTNEMGAVTRTVLETLRTLVVWILDLLLYYGPPLGKGTKLGEPWTDQSWLQALGFAVLVAGTLVYGWGEELQEAELRRLARHRAREHWARIRASLPELMAAARTRRRLTPEERMPLKPPRIAGPARIRTGFLPVLFVNRLQGLARPRWGAIAASSTHLPDHHFQFGVHSHGQLSAQHSAAQHLLDPVPIPPHPHPQARPPPRQAQDLADVVEAAVAAVGEGGSGEGGFHARSAPASNLLYKE